MSDSEPPVAMSHDSSVTAFVAQHPRIAGVLTATYLLLAAAAPVAAGPGIGGP